MGIYLSLACMRDFKKTLLSFNLNILILKTKQAQAGILTFKIRVSLRNAKHFMASNCGNLTWHVGQVL